MKGIKIFEFKKPVLILFLTGFISSFLLIGIIYAQSTSVNVVGAVVKVLVNNGGQNIEFTCTLDDSNPITPTNPPITTTVVGTVRPTDLPVDGDVPPPNYKIAFIGDSGGSSWQFPDVLNLIKAEGVSMVLHQGDFGYDDSAQDFESTVDSVLGADFPYLGSVGNHDSWGDYQPMFERRLAAMGIPGSASENYAATYQGFKMVFNQEGGNTSFNQSELSGDTHVWKICSWHHNRVDLQPGGKGDDVALETYQACLDAGAIIATGHEHSYSRTCTLSDFVGGRDYGADCSIPNKNEVGGGKSFVFVSGLGGKSSRDYHSNHDSDTWWSTIYTSNRYCKNTCTKSDQSGQNLVDDIPSYNYDYGALIIEFHIDGDPRKARGYFKNIKGDIIDEFELYSNN